MSLQKSWLVSHLFVQLNGFTHQKSRPTMQIVPNADSVRFSEETLLLSVPFIHGSGGRRHICGRWAAGSFLKTT